MKRNYSVEQNRFFQHGGVSVEVAAKRFNVSRRRVRCLLAQGRLDGSREPGKRAWMVTWPPRIRYGSRGPRFGSLLVDPRFNQQGTVFNIDRKGVRKKFPR